MQNDDLNYRLLRAITRAQSGFIIGQNTGDLFDRLLDSLLDLTDSAYGFIGEVMRDPDGGPYLKSHAITNIAWNAETRKFYEENAPKGLEFRNLKTLFGTVLTGGQPVISNDPAGDPRAGGIPEGHPPLRAFLGIPFYSADTFVGMVGIANRPAGYSKALIVFLKPLLDTCANIIQAYRLDQRRIRAEADLKESEGQIRAILDGAHDAIIAADERGIIQSFNPAAERIFGYPAEAVTGENVRMLMPEPFRSRHDGYIAYYLATGVKKIIGIGREAQAMRADGEVFPIDLAITEATSGEHRRFVGVIRDITQRKEARKRLDDAMAAMEKSRDNLAAVLNQARMGSVMIDAEGRVTHISRHCQPILGQPPETLTGRLWKDICPFGPAEKAELAAAFAAPMARRRKVAASVTESDGQERHLEIEIHDDPRGLSGKILFLYDVTEVLVLRRQLADQSRFGDIIGKSDAIRRIFSQIRDLADVNATVLIEGETGTGKELVAKALHGHSNRKEGPFVAVNCGGLTESLVASQLFGHRRGAFTGAAEDRIGVFEAASAGVLFLDEIGEIPLTVQAQLLRVLQEREITRIGETKARKIDVRLIAATNRTCERRSRRAGSGKTCSSGSGWPSSTCRP